MDTTEGTAVTLRCPFCLELNRLDMARAADRTHQVGSLAGKVA